MLARDPDADDVRAMAARAMSGCRFALLDAGPPRRVAAHQRPVESNDGARWVDVAEASSTFAVDAYVYGAGEIRQWARSPQRLRWHREVLSSVTDTTVARDLAWLINELVAPA